jgi:hypothetical protein
MRYAFPATVVLALAVVLGARRLTDTAVPDVSPVPAPPEYSWSEMRGIYVNQRRLDDDLQRQQRFAEAIRQAENDAATGCISLEEAGCIVHQEAERNNPAFLRIVANRYPGRPISEQFEQLIVDHLRDAERQGKLTVVQKAVVSRAGSKLGRQGTAK